MSKGTLVHYNRAHVNSFNEFMECVIKILTTVHCEPKDRYQASIDVTGWVEHLKVIAPEVIHSDRVEIHNTVKNVGLVVSTWMDQFGYNPLVTTNPLNCQ